MKIALAQIDSKPDLAYNIEKHINFIEKAIAEQADLVVFPELSLSGDVTKQNLGAICLSQDQLATLPFYRLSQHIDIVFGVIEFDGEFYYNAAFYLSQQQVIHHHRKLFLVDYSIFEEGQLCQPGNELEVFQSQQVRSGLIICNDAWHAVTPYLMALKNIDILIVPANSATGSLDENLDIRRSWEYMNRAYSSMMSFYTIFVNRTGTTVRNDTTYRFWGGSEIIDPRGNVTIKAPYDMETIIYAEIDPLLAAEQRKSTTILRDHRPDFLLQQVKKMTAEI